MDQIMKKLKGNVSEGLDNIMAIPPASDEKKKEVESVDILMKELVEQQKIELEKEKMKIEEKKAKKQMLIGWGQIGLQLTLQVLMIASVTYWQKSGQKFEVDGYERSPYLKGLINRMIPRIW